MSEELKFTVDSQDRTPDWSKQIRDHTIDAARYAIWTPPVAGWWILPGGIPNCQTKFATPSKPNWLHRKMMQWLMGWRWEASNGS